MKLEDIGFYTLSDSRVINSSSHSPLWRCELILTDRCNFRCLYCRGLRQELTGDIPIGDAHRILDYWINEGLINVRFSGGEPTLYRGLPMLVGYCKYNGVERIAISTNGSADLSYYNALIEVGVNDFSISLDACCSNQGDEIAGGVRGSWRKVVMNINEIAKQVYVTVGMVFTRANIDTVVDNIKFASSLGVADIRIVSAAQDNRMIKELQKIPETLLNRHPILKYRVSHYLGDRNVRGILGKDSHRCKLVLDDMAVAGGYHFPCIIYLREGGNPISIINNNMRKERYEWYRKHNSYEDPICRKNCLDVCIDFNNKANDNNGGNDNE